MIIGLSLRTALGSFHIWVVVTRGNFRRGEGDIGGISTRTSEITHVNWDCMNTGTDRRLKRWSDSVESSGVVHYQSLWWKLRFWFRRRWRWQRSRWHDGPRSSRRKYGRRRTNGRSFICGRSYTCFVQRRRVEIKLQTKKQNRHSTKNNVVVNWAHWAKVSK